ncbi:MULTISPECIES: iron ABC transporter permease [Cyanophyceae]|uniref:FecCD family ABC transporter permease n=1 Tax=Cyanophyceae TaxID=3028117 RepID=UPI0016885819|nr:MULTISPECIES: iron ABC transporter permease [Cyanophyceae]MBD1918259.1 iron ABC transporter permease [Phormidium sp. FACHB-77]MBD2031303.1 iron ABC transporter permease [Phormidium sp. FACHB-322]MBD2052370.1 iron ABC transporter permease [Leptolyngbya sp. FACHB-60]
MVAKTVQSRPLPLSKSPALLTLGLGTGCLILLGCLLSSILLGAAEIAPQTVWQAVFQFDGSTEHLIIRTVRLPRAILAVVVGAALAVAGAITQGLTRNPLAAPDILGIDMGAALAMVLAVFLRGSGGSYVGFAFAGAAIAAITVYWLGSLGRSGLTPLKLVIAGSAIWYLLSSLTYGILILSQRTLDEIRFWLAGSLAGQDMASVLPVLPYIAIGLVASLALGRQLTLMSLGEDVAQGLGLQTAWVKVGAAIAVVLLAGSAVALAGPIGFVGLVVPHVVRFAVGVDYRWILPYSILVGGILLSVADLAARLVIRPQELPVGIMTALVGAPFFIYLARSKIKR